MNASSARPPTSVAVAVSTVILALRPDGSGGSTLWLPLVRRIREPFKDRWALPGGWVGDQESLADAAARSLAETTGLRPSYLEQLYTFGAPERSAGSRRVVSVVYTALVRGQELADAGTGENVRWFRADHVPELAFDHSTIVEYALWRLRNKVEYAQVASLLLDETFSMSQLREVYEAILRRRLDPANFRRRVEATGTIIPTEERLTGARHRPARLYRCNPTLTPQRSGPDA